MQWQVDDVMTREVTTVDVDTPVGQIANLLDREGISAVPVTAATGGVVGVVSQADLLAGVARGERGDHPPGRARAVRAADVMSTPAVYVDAGATLAEAARTMQRRNVRRLLVTGSHGQLLGVVSRGDLLRPYARHDAAIRREVETVLRDRLWIRPEEVGVRVHNGTAMLTGAVGRRSTGDIATRLAAAVPGVTEVLNHIRYDFDDAALARSKVSRTHPFSAEPFRPDRPGRRSRRRARQHA
jgi:CBS domain-containing protein